MSIIIVLGTRCYQYNCITCGVPFTVPETKIDHEIKVGRYHYCPNGHTQGWDKNGRENERLRRERDRLKQDAARLQDEAAEARRQTEEERKKVARLKKRASAGNCPC